MRLALATAAASMCLSAAAVASPAIASFSVPVLDCTNWPAAVASPARLVQGVISVQADVDRRRLRFLIDDPIVEPREIIAALKSAGFAAKLVNVKPASPGDV